MTRATHAVRRALGPEFRKELAAEVRRVRDVLTIVHGPVDRARLLVAWFLLTVKFRVGVWPGIEFRIRWTGPGGPLSAVVGDVSELRVLREMFVIEEYRLPERHRPSVIVDLGSNIGLSVLYFASRYPGARIVAVEPHPRTFALLERNTAHLPTVERVHAAVGGESGVVTIYTGGESWSAAMSPGADRSEPVDVPAMTLEVLIARAGLDSIDLLKMDIEGSEFPVLASPAIARTGLVVFEFHQEYSDEPLHDVVTGLPEFEMVQCVGDVATHPLVTLERR